MSDDLVRIASRLDGGEPLTSGDVEWLVGTVDLIGLGTLADTRRRKLHGDRVTFVRVSEVSIEGLSASEVDVPVTAGEVRIVGEPSTREAAVTAVGRVVDRSSGVPVAGFVLDQLAQLCGEDSDDLSRTLTALKDAGLAHIAAARVEAKGLLEWLEVADGVGLDVSTLTVDTLDGPGDAERIRVVAGLRPSVANVRAFAPLPRITSSRATTGYGDARQVALARLLVDNIDSIQVDWAAYGPKMAQVALTFGADDLDAVSPVESAEQGWRRAPLEEVVRNIRAAALVPVQRNGRFEMLDA